MSTTILLTEPLVFIRLAFGSPSRVRQLPVSEEKAQDAGTKADRLKTALSLYSRDAFKAIGAADSALKSHLFRLVIPVATDFHGAYILPRALLAQAETLLEDAATTRQTLVDEFIEGGAYINEQEIARAELGSAFNQADYPPADALREQFTMKWRYFTLEVPAELPAQLQEQEYAKFQENLSVVATDCRAALREGLAGLVQHLVERLTPDPEGRTKRLHATTIENLRAFLDVLDARDITGDEEIRTLGNAARVVLGNVTAQELRTDEDASVRIRDGLAIVAENVQKLVQTEGRRRFDFSDDEESAA